MQKDICIFFFFLPDLRVVLTSAVGLPVAYCDLLVCAFELQVCLCAVLVI